MFINLATCAEKFRKQAADILFSASKSVTRESWATLEACETEVAECCEPNYITCGLVTGNELLGWVGLRLMYTVTWELHPIMVDPSRQRKGIGGKLVAEIEKIARARNILNIILGTDDELEQTSLSGKDLYGLDLYEEIKNIRNLGGHPFEFYQKCGYKIVGVIPDASGRGKPDILMGKRIG